MLVKIIENISYIDRMLTSALSRRFAFISDFVWGTNTKRTVFLIVVVSLILCFFIIYRGTSAGTLVTILVTSIGVYLITRQPVYGMLILIFVQIVLLGEQVTVPFLNMTISLVKFFGVFIMVSFAVHYAVLKKPISFGDKYQAAFLSGLFFMVVLSSFRSFSFGMIIARAIKFALLAIFYILSYNLLNNMKWIRLLILVLLGSTILNFFIALYQVTGLGIPRPTGGSSGAILMSYYSNMGLIGFVILFGYYKDLKYKIINGIGAVITGAGVLLSNSRGPVIAAIAVFMVLFIRERRNYKFYLAVVLIAVVVLSIVPSEQLTRVNNLFELVGKGETQKMKSDLRYHLFMAGLEMIARYPITGVGAFNYGIYYRDEYAPRTGSRPGAWTPHNGFLVVFAELGILGMLFFMGYVVITLVFIYRSDRIFKKYEKPVYRLYNTIIGFWLFSFYISGFFEEMMIVRFFYILPAVAAVMYSIALRVKRENSIIDRLNVYKPGES